MTGLLTDLYELTMAAGYLETGRAHEIATFELLIRRLPRNRNFVIAAGIEQAADYLLNLHFTAEDIRYLHALPQFSRAGSGFFDALRAFRFTGDVYAVAEGTPLFAGEPVMSVRAPLMEAQIPETYLLATITFQTLIASKAARVAAAAGERAVMEFGTRRAHTPEAGVLGARAAYLGGCAGTSNALAGKLFDLPVFGTAAHSWVMSFAGEEEAFRCLQQLLGPNTVQLVDTYDTIEGARRAAALGEPLWGVRIDSGDFATLSRKVRQILDDAGLQKSRIMVSGDLDEYRIRELLASGAPIDAFGVGTELATSADAPSMGSVYKLVEIESGGTVRYAAKFSEDKTTFPGRKQIYRFSDFDRLDRSDGDGANGRPLLEPLIQGGKRVPPAKSLREMRAESLAQVRALSPVLRALEAAPPYRVEYSPELLELTEMVREMQG